MADVNEEILAQYLKVVKKWFYVEDISFQVPRNYSNIDLLAFNPGSRKHYDFEVKYRSAYTLPKKEIHYLADQFLKYDKQRKAKIEEFIGTEVPIVKVIVTTYQMLGKATKRKEMENKFIQTMKSNNYEAQIWYFDNIVPELVNSISNKGRYNTQLLQTIRMLKSYNVIT